MTINEVRIGEHRVWVRSEGEAITKKRDMIKAGCDPNTLSSRVMDVPITNRAALVAWFNAEFGPGAGR